LTNSERWVFKKEREGEGGRGRGERDKGREGRWGERLRLRDWEGNRERVCVGEEEKG